MSMSVICSVDAHSPARRAGVKAGETLLQINGHPILDVLDYKFYSYDARLTLLLRTEKGRERQVKIRKQEGQDLGLNFETYLMDQARSCANRCIFCFVDQLPKGMRSTLYFKDDDARLSFLMGNYITLTNLSQREVDRIAQLHVSPIHISVHTTDPEVRRMMLQNRNAGQLMERMKRFAQAGITMHCQIVCCPGINDGAQLQKTMEDLAGLYPQVSTVSVVPVGLTGHREGLYPLKPYDRTMAQEVLNQVETFAQKCLERRGTRIFWCSDEFYLRANRPIPSDSFYEEYAQLENGVGMLRLLRTEFERALEQTDPAEPIRPFAVACGVDAACWIRDLLGMAAEKHPLSGTVYPIVNHFFGESITVSGLVTGQDLLDQLRGRPLGDRLLLPINMLRHGEDVFLDDVTVSDLAKELQVEVVPVEQDGGALWDAILDIGTGTSYWTSDGIRSTKQGKEN